MKECSSCHVVKPLTDFSKQAKGKFGVTSKCKACKRVQTRNCNSRNKEKYKEVRKEWLKANPWYSRFNNYWSVRGKDTRIDSERDAMAEFYKNCPIGCEVDHIKPLSKGGTHTLDNVQYLTILENKLKGDKYDD